MDTAQRLAGQTALVTGAARRIGAEVVRALHAEGARVTIHCHRSQEAAQRLADDLNRTRSDSAAVEVADLRDSARLPQLIERTCARFGGLNLLINNASSFYPTPLGRITLSDWEDLIGTNLRAPLFLAQAAAPSLREHRGGLINIVDIHGLRPLREHVVYGVAKAGLIMLTRALARELAPEVRVNGIAPGPILWPEQGMEPGRRDRILELTPLGHSGSPQDIARAVLFLALDAPFVTGQILGVDGGRSIGW
jgi:pteridine reductase